MGKSFSNSASHQLNKEELLIHMKYEANREGGSYEELWE